MPVARTFWVERVAILLRKLGFTVEVFAPHEKHPLELNPDIIINYHVITVHQVYDWAAGVGYALYFARKHQSKAVVLLLRMNDSGKQEQELAKLAVKSNVPPVAIWVLDANASTLDMGDGRVISLEDL